MALPQQKHLSQGSCWVLLLGDPHPGVCVACQGACPHPVSLVLPPLYSSWLTGGSRAEEVHCAPCVLLSSPPDALLPFFGLCPLWWPLWCPWVWLLVLMDWGSVGMASSVVVPLWVFFCLSLWVNLFFFLACFSSVIFPFCEFCFVHWRNLFSLWVLH